jgi:hypothetical protein
MTTSLNVIASPRVGAAGRPRKGSAKRSRSRRNITKVIDPSVFRRRCTRLSVEQPGEKAGVAKERRLGAREVEQIFAAFAEAMRELPPDVEAGWLDAQGDLRLAPDIARKLRTARRVRQLLQELQQREREG